MLTIFHPILEIPIEFITTFQLCFGRKCQSLLTTRIFPVIVHQPIDIPCSRNQTRQGRFIRRLCTISTGGNKDRIDRCPCTRILLLVLEFHLSGIEACTVRRKSRTLHIRKIAPCVGSFYRQACLRMTVNREFNRILPHLIIGRDRHAPQRTGSFYLEINDIMVARLHFPIFRLNCPCILMERTIMIHHCQ